MQKSTSVMFIFIGLVAIIGSYWTFEQEKALMAGSIRVEGTIYNIRGSYTYGSIVYIEYYDSNGNRHSVWRGILTGDDLGGIVDIWYATSDPSIYSFRPVHSFSAQLYGTFFIGVSMFIVSLDSLFVEIRRTRHSKRRRKESMFTRIYESFIILMARHGSTSRWGRNLNQGANFYFDDLSLSRVGLGEPIKKLQQLGISLFTEKEEENWFCHNYPQLGLVIEEKDGKVFAYELALNENCFTFDRFMGSEKRLFKPFSGKWEYQHRPININPETTYDQIVAIFGPTESKDEIDPDDVYHYLDYYSIREGLVCCFIFDEEKKILAMRVDYKKEKEQ